MKRLEKFNRFLFEANYNMKLLISPELKSILENIEHPIAVKILENATTNTNDFSITFLDIDKKDPKVLDNISYALANKVISNNIAPEDRKNKSDDIIDAAKLAAYMNNLNNYEQKSRTTTSLGRVVKKLFPGVFDESGDYGKDVESFVDMYKAMRDDSNFDIVNGEDIEKYYDSYNHSGSGGSLHGSCMNDEFDYLKLYSENTDKVQLVILKDKDEPGLIKGRALLWKLDSHNEPFMDRIYFDKLSDVYLFKEYAKKNKWIYKRDQDMDSSGPFIFPDISNGVPEGQFYINDMDKPSTNEYPYMDTMKYYDGSTLSNVTKFVDNEYSKMESTNGNGFESGNWSEFYQEFINPEDDYISYCDNALDENDAYRRENDYYWSKHYEETFTNEYVERWLYEMDHYDSWDDKYRKGGDFVETYEGNKCTPEYAEENFAWSQYHGEWLEDYQYSEKMEDNIAEDEAVEVYTDASATDTDWRINDKSDGEWWTWIHDNENYCDDVTKEDLQEYHDLDENNEPIDEDAEYSIYNERNLDEDERVLVQTKADSSEEDYRLKDKKEGNWFTLKYDDVKYDSRITLDELKDYYKEDIEKDPDVLKDFVKVE